ncbi:MAG: cation transporter [Clostridia bacterium]|nr:cation transporter [Clostridia bacterium]
MDRNKVIIKTSILGIVVNVILVIFKAIVGLIANSIAIILDAVNNLTDALSSVITIVGTKLSNKAPDKKHPYGYGRIEYFTSVIISAIVLFAGITAAKESIEKIINPAEAEYSITGLIIIAVAVVVKFVFGRYVKNTGKKVNSQSLVASGQDAFMDSILSFTTLVAAIINYIWHLSLEGYLGAIISIVIIKSAVEMLKETVDSMLGERADKELTTKLKEKLMEFKDVQGAYDLNIHNYGPSKIVASVHIQVRNDMTAEEIHILTRKIEYDIYMQFGIVLTIGIYAANDKGEYGEIKKELQNIIKEYKTILQVHGFYVDKENNDVYFDLILDFEEKNKEKIMSEIIEKLKSKYSKYNFNVILDSDISD